MLSACKTLGGALTGMRRAVRCTCAGSALVGRLLEGADAGPWWLHECGEMLSQELANLNTDAISVDDKANMIQVICRDRE